MDVDPASFIGVFFILLFLSAFFSGSETAFFSLNQLTIEKLAQQKKKGAGRVVRLLNHPRRLLITILIGNTLVNVSAAAIATILTTQSCERFGINQSIGIIFNIVVVTFLILVLSEITPKIFAVKNAEVFALRVSALVSIVYFVFFPITIIIDKSVALLTGIFKIRESKEEAFLHASEFQALLELGEEQGELEEEEKEMIHSIFEFGDTIVREIMVPRTDMVCVSDDTCLTDLIQIIKERGHTRIPIFLESIDKIQGIINAKDLLPIISNSTKKFEISSLARPAIFVPEGKKIDELLRLFQKERQHLAIVVDEYGGTSGLVTLEDVIEEIVGDIRDEYDQEQALYKKINENSFLVSAKIDVESLNNLLDINIPIKDEYDTLGGFILEILGSVPTTKDIINHGDYELIMEKVEKNRIISVQINYKPQPIQHDDD